MPIAHLDRKTISALTLAEGKREQFFWDDELTGYAVRVRMDGAGKVTKTYIIQYRFEGQGRKIKIGDVAKVGADQAREQAEKLFAQITLKVDPAAKRDEARAAKAAATAATTFGEAVEKYLTKKAPSAPPLR